MFLGFSADRLVVVWPKLAPGGCFTAHNVTGPTAWFFGGIREFWSHLSSLPDAETTLDRSSNQGISVTYKRR